MGKKKDCFGQEDYTCMTPSCPYAKECIQAVWALRLERAMARRGKADTVAPAKRRGRARIATKR